MARESRDRLPPPVRLCRVLKGFGIVMRDLIFPPVCAACSSPMESSVQGRLCPACESAIRPIEGPLCTLCGEPFSSTEGADHLCGRCILDPPVYRKARSAFPYTGPVRTLIHRIKFHGDGYALRALCEMARRNPPVDLSKPQTIVPVPLHPARLRQRGFNQAARIARGMFPETALVLDLLQRVRDTPAQTGLPAQERLRNVKGAFAVAHPFSPHARTITLVDDVFTTGATARTAARALKDAGFEMVEVFTVARATKNTRP